MANSKIEFPAQATAVGPAVLDHVAFGVRHIDSAALSLMNCLGAEPYMSGPGIEFRGAQVRAPGGGLIELIEPDGGPEGFLARFLEMRGPGIHHVTFKVPKIEVARDALDASGYEIVGFSDAVPGWKEMFLHPKQAQGIVIQIAEADPSLDDGWSDAWPYPTGKPPSSPVTVRGFRLNAGNTERAQRQWGAVLGGRRSRDGELDVFEWPDSPLRIAVQSDSELPDGPVGIEIDENSDPSNEEAASLLGHEFLRT
jgi:methylmalonyl-CoA/ethylmalonyl-CoA epimerase